MHIYCSVVHRFNHTLLSTLSRLCDSLVNHTVTVSTCLAIYYTDLSIYCFSLFFLPFLIGVACSPQQEHFRVLDWLWHSGCAFNGGCLYLIVPLTGMLLTGDAPNWEAPNWIVPVSVGSLRKSNTLTWDKYF